MAFARTYRRLLHECADEQRGYVSTRDARQLGIPPVALRQLAAYGGLERVGHGIYRFQDAPATEKDEFFEATLLVGDDARLVADSVLALHDLAHVAPRRIKVGTPHRVRGKLPVTITTVRTEATTPVKYDGIPSDPLKKALIDCRDIVTKDRLLEACDEAVARSLLTTQAAHEVASMVNA